MEEKIRSVVAAFKIEGRLLDIAPHKSGHINDSYLSTWEIAGQTKQFIHQRINHLIFKDINGLMGNIERVIAHLKKKIESGETPEDFLALTLCRTKEGKSFFSNSDGTFWRSYDYIEGTETFDRCPTIAHAKEGGRIFGLFQRLLSDIPLKGLILTIPNFDNVPLRFAALEEAIREDRVSRVSAARAEIDYAKGEVKLSSLFSDLLEKHKVPKRVTHYDTKLNNVLFRRGTPRAIAVTDLDTCMPGCSLYDYGDLVRNSAVPCNEDEKDLSKIALSRDYYNAIRDGYLTEAKQFLNQAEIDAMHLAPGLNALNLGVRFLTDFLCGDTYFKVSYPDHNLIRARAQFKIAEVLKVS